MDVVVVPNLFSKGKNVRRDHKGENKGLCRNRRFFSNCILEFFVVFRSCSARELILNSIGKGVNLGSLLKKETGQEKEKYSFCRNSRSLIFATLAEVAQLVRASDS
jgi:hypothetical protein